MERNKNDKDVSWPEPCARRPQPPGPELTSVEREGGPDLSPGQKDLVGRDKNINYLNVNIFPSFFIKLLLLRMFRLKSYKNTIFSLCPLLFFALHLKAHCWFLKGKNRLLTGIMTIWRPRFCSVADLCLFLIYMNSKPGA